MIKLLEERYYYKKKKSKTPWKERVAINDTINDKGKAIDAVLGKENKGSQRPLVEKNFKNE